MHKLNLMQEDAALMLELRFIGVGFACGVRMLSQGERPNTLRGSTTDGRDKWRKLKGSDVSFFAVCINNAEYPASLELHKICRVIPDKDAATDGDMQVIDESGEDYLYPAQWFVLIELPDEVEQSLLQVA